MPVEFIGLINMWESSELHPRPGGAPDAAYIKRYAPGEATPDLRKHLR